MGLLEDVKMEEGFSGTVYKCTEGFDTIGYGTKLPLTKKESEALLILRLSETTGAVKSSLYFLEIEDEAWDILHNMGYQLGITGLLKFKKMIKALKVQDYNEASIEMLDSKWAKQTPTRAVRLSTRMRNLSDFI